MKIIEKWGIGIPRLFEACEEYGLPKSELIDFDGDFRVNMYRKVKGEFGVNGATTQTTQTHQTTQSKELTLSDDDKKILDLLDNIKNNISAGEDFNALNFQNDIILLTKYSQVYLKLEWERVKYEIRGEKDLTAEQMQANEISLLKEKYYHEYLKQERNN